GGMRPTEYVPSGFLIYPCSVIDFRNAKSVTLGSPYEKSSDFTRAEPPGSSAKWWNKRTRLQSLVVLISNPGLYSENASYRTSRAWSRPTALPAPTRPKPA